MQQNIPLGLCSVYLVLYTGFIHLISDMRELIYCFLPGLAVTQPLQPSLHHWHNSIPYTEYEILKEVTTSPPPQDAGLKRQLFLIRFFSFFFLVLRLLNSIPQRCSQGKAHGKRLSEYTAVILMEPFAVVKMPHIFLDQIKKIMPGAARPALNKMRRQRV